MIIERGPTYVAGGVTTLMSVGNPLDDITSKVPRAALYAGGAYLAAYLLGFKSIAKWSALAAAGASYVRII